MSFLHRRRSLQAFHDVEEKEPKPISSKHGSLTPSSAAVENVPQKRGRYKTTGASHLIKRVSAIFVTRKKSTPNSTIVDNSLSSNSRPRSFSSSQASLESEDDIRRPSGLGSAVSLRSNQSLPPSPFSSTGPQGSSSPFTSFSSGEPPRTRALSSPNLLRSLTWNVQAKVKPRRASIAPAENPHSSISPKTTLPVPEEILRLIFLHLPRHDVALSATVSRTFASVARTTLYSSLDFDSLSPSHSEILIAQLASRRDLTDLVTTFICRKWPPFFLPESHGEPTTGTQNKQRIIKHQDALLTATFTLALERMANLHSLTLPSFDISLLSHHSAFALRSLTFLNQSLSEAETQAMLAWLEGQPTVTCLRLTNLEDTIIKMTDTPPHSDDTHSHPAPLNGGPFLLKPSNVSPHASPCPSPRSSNFLLSSSPPKTTTDISSPTLLPNLTILHATPALVMSLFSSPESTPPSPSSRPLKSVTLNINTTLYCGLRPAALMYSLRGIEHLSLRFMQTIDKRSLEKVLGAAGASLGSVHKPSISSSGGDGGGELGVSSGEMSGLRSLEISFQDTATPQSGRDEAVYKSLHSSLARYKKLSSLRLFIESESHSPDRATDIDTDTDISPTDAETTSPPPPPSPVESTLIDSWVKLCPTLMSITLFSGARWRYDPQVPLKPKEHKVFKFP